MQPWRLELFHCRDHYNGRPSVILLSKTCCWPTISPFVRTRWPGNASTLLQWTRNENFKTTPTITRAMWQQYQASYVAVYVCVMSKRPIDSDSSSSSTSSSASSSKSKKRKVSIHTFNKWQLQYEREHWTLSWLRCDVDKRDRTSVETLWCEACRQHESSITGMKNFSSAWITGSTSQVYKTR